MSKLTRCDCCGKIIESNSYFEIIIRQNLTFSSITLTDNNKDIDLCEHCYTELRINSKQIFK